MKKVLVILYKEWLDIRLQRGLMLGIVLPPVIFTVLPIVFLAFASQLSTTGSSSGSASSLGTRFSALAGMTAQESAQALLGMQFSILFLLLPIIIPGVIAAYSIIGEKTSHTLEPVLATPIRTWELLVGKSLIALLPAIGITWLCGLVFIASVAVFAVSSRVFATIVTPGWIIVFLLWTPAFALIAIAVMVAVSSRVNDTRTAQQISAWAVVPFLTIFFGQLSGLVVLGPLFTLSVFVVLILLAILTVWIATRLFQREIILTRWK